MKSHELHKKFNEEFGLNEWPKTYEVDAETYGYCCQAVFNQAEERNVTEILKSGKGDLALRKIFVGEHGGLLFKMVELIIK